MLHSGPVCVFAEAPTHIVASCTERKRALIPDDLHLRSFEAGVPSVRAAKWWSQLEQHPENARHLVDNLYCGEHWTLAQRALNTLADVGAGATLWAASAGYGLVPASARVCAYSATFAHGVPDSVTRDSVPGWSRLATLQAWWQALCSFPGPLEREPRSLKTLAEASPRSALVVVASPDYIRAMRQDLLAARESLANRDLLTVVSNHDLLGDEELAGNLIPVDARCRTLLGGTMQGLNARVALDLLQWGHPGPFTAPRLRERYETMVSDAEKPPKPNRERMDDKDVVAFLRAELAKDPRAGWTLLLRTLRGSGRACEQSRFRELHQQIREEVLNGPQQGLKLDQG